jgi:membrane-associated phospholipid phosphatase
LGASSRTAHLNSSPEPLTYRRFPASDVGIPSTGMSFSAQQKRPAWYLEVPLLLVGYLVFGFVRGRIDRGEQLATGNALIVQGIEQNLHLAVENPINQAMLGHPFAIYLTGYFYRLCLIAVPIVLVWLYVSWPGYYRYLRTVLVVATLLDLPLVWIFPESPPRFAQDGIVDYVATFDILGGGSLRDPQSGLNLLAAMPSMHIAWTSWCAYAVWSVLRQRRPRSAWLAWLYPVLAAFDVMATGHHYVLDILGGVAVLAMAIGVTRWLANRRWSFAGAAGEAAGRG